MKRFRDIIEDIKAPSPQDLWLNAGHLKYYGNSGWMDIAFTQFDEAGNELSLSTVAYKVENLAKEVEFLMKNAVTSTGNTVEQDSLDIKSFNEPYWEYDEDLPNNRFKATVVSDTEIQIAQVKDPDTTPDIIHNWWAYAYARALTEEGSITATMSCDGFVIVDGKIMNLDGTKKSVRISTNPVVANVATTVGIDTIYQEGVTYDNIYVYFLPASMEVDNYTVTLGQSNTESSDIDETNEEEEVVTES